MELIPISGKVFERDALQAALAAIGRTPKAEELHRAATNLSDPEAVSKLRALVHDASFAPLGPVSELVVQNSSESLGLNEIQQELLRGLETDWGKLSNERKGGKSWAEVWQALPKKEAFLKGCQKLKTPTPYFINQQGQLVMGDGCAAPDPATLGKKKSYHQSRKDETRYAYIDAENNLQIKEGDIPDELPEGATLAWARGLVSKEEYEAVNIGQFEKDEWIWIESGNSPSLAHAATWLYVKVSFEESHPGCNKYGSRRVLRVNLNFES